MSVEGVYDARLGYRVSFLTITSCNTLSVGSDILKLINTAYTAITQNEGTTAKRDKLS